MVEPTTLHDPLFRGLVVATFLLTLACFGMVCRMDRRLGRMLAHLDPIDRGAPDPEAPRDLGRADTLGH